MDLDDPTIPEFASWRSFQEFERRVKQERRYAWNDKIKAFLDTVLATCKNRSLNIGAGENFVRAQCEVEHRPTYQDGFEIGTEPQGCGAARMVPRANRATEGRANPAGIPVLYLSVNSQTAIAEVRPLVGAEVTLAEFVVCRDLKALDLTQGHERSPLPPIGSEKASAKRKEHLVWTDIDKAFSRPVTRADDLADYAPTQILAETFRNAGYDALIFRSQFGDDGWNVALFDVSDARPVASSPVRVTDIEVKFIPIGNSRCL